MKLKTKEDYKNFQRYLYENAKQESVEDKAAHSKIIATNKPIICLSMAFIRKVAKQISKDDATSYLQVAEPKTYEETMIYGLVVVQLPHSNKKFELIRKYLDLIDSWSLVDSVCISLKFKENERQEYFEFFKNLSKSQKEFVSRFGIVCLMNNFLDEKHIDEVLELFLEINNSAYYVQMALSWGIAEAYIKQKDKTLKLIQSKTLPGFVQNKAISKICDSFRVQKEEKEMLKKYRKKSEK